MTDEAYRRLPAERHQDLDPEVRKFLDELREEEVASLRDFARMSAEERKQLLSMMRLSQSIMTVSRFMRAIIIFVVGTFMAAVVLSDNIAKVWHWVTTWRTP